MIQPWQIKSWALAHKMLIAIAIGFFLVLVLWWSGINVIGKVSNWWYDRGTQEAHEEINKARGEAAAAKAVAEEALKELAAEKEITAKLTAERERTEKILADKSLTASEKLKAYDEALKKPVSATPVTDDLDALCQRARKLGIECSE